MGGLAAIPGGGTTLLPDTAAAFQGRLYVFGDRLYLFAIGTDDHRHYRFLRRLELERLAPRAGRRHDPARGTTALPDAATTFQGKVYLFAVGANDHQHYMNVIP